MTKTGAMALSLLVAAAACGCETENDRRRNRWSAWATEGREGIDWEVQERPSFLGAIHAPALIAESETRPPVVLVFNKEHEDVHLIVNMTMPEGEAETPEGEATLSCTTISLSDERGVLTRFALVPTSPSNVRVWTMPSNVFSEWARQTSGALDFCGARYALALGDGEKLVQFFAAAEQREADQEAATEAALTIFAVPGSVSAEFDRFEVESRVNINGMGLPAVSADQPVLGLNGTGFPSGVLSISLVPMPAHGPEVHELPPLCGRVRALIDGVPVELGAPDWRGGVGGFALRPQDVERLREASSFELRVCSQEYSFPQTHLANLQEAARLMGRAGSGKVNGATARPTTPRPMTTRESADQRARRELREMIR